MIEILLITLLVFAVSGYGLLYVREKRKSRALTRGAAPLRLASPVVLPTKEETHRKAEEEWLLEYAKNLPPRQQANMERVWNNWVEKNKPRTREERERRHREFLIKVARKLLERELDN